MYVDADYPLDVKNRWCNPACQTNISYTVHWQYNEDRAAEMVQAHGKNRIGQMGKQGHE